MSFASRQLRAILLAILAVTTTACDHGVLISGSVLTAADSAYPAALEGSWVDSSDYTPRYNLNAVEARSSEKEVYTSRGYLVSQFKADSTTVWIGGAGIARVGATRYLVELSDVSTLPGDARFRGSRNGVPGRNRQWTDPRAGSQVGALSAAFIDARIPLLCQQESVWLRCDYLRTDSISVAMRRQPRAVPGVEVNGSAILDGKQLDAQRLAALFRRPGFTRRFVTLRREQ